MVSVSHFASGSAALIQCPGLVGPAPSLAGEGGGGGGEKGMQWEKEEAVDSQGTPAKMEAHMRGSVSGALAFEVREV